MITRELLQGRERPVQLAVVGLGAMGTGTVALLRSSPGIRCVVAADLAVDNAVAALREQGIPRERIVATNKSGEAADALRSGKCVATEDGLLPAFLDVEVVLEATGHAAFGARVAWESILAGKHVVMLTVETDVVVGPVLARQAEGAGVVYTLAAGDQPGSILELYHWADSLGFEIVAAGRGTIRYPEDRHQGPHEEKHGRPWISNSPTMVNSFRDGTKSQIEMAAVSNATGLLPDVRGMHEPHVAVRDLARLFATKEKGGILDRSGVIELANAVSPDGTQGEHDQVGMGVFVVIDSDHPRVQTFLHQAHSTQSGEHGVALYRPYHMTCLEVPISIARAALLDTATARPVGLVSDVAACAKRDLRAGETVEGPGGATVYGVVERADKAREDDIVPFGLAEGARLLRPVERDRALTYADVELRCDPFLLHLRRLQDATM